MLLSEETKTKATPCSLANRACVSSDRLLCTPGLPPKNDFSSIIYTVSASDWSNLGTWTANKSATFPALPQDGFEDPSNPWEDPRRPGICEHTRCRRIPPCATRACPPTPTPLRRQLCLQISPVIFLYCLGPIVHTPSQTSPSKNLT